VFPPSSKTLLTSARLAVARRGRVGGWVRFGILGSVVLGPVVVCSAAVVELPELVKPAAPIPQRLSLAFRPAQSEQAPLIVRVGEYVERYYARAQSLLAQEHVSVQPLGRDMGADGFGRRLVYELRVEWDPEGSDGETATVVRQLVSVNGRPPRPGDEPRCTDPRALSPEPLAALLPSQRGKYVFHPGGQGRIDGRRAATFEYRSIRAEQPRVEWKDDCASIDLPGRTRGRVWVDPETAAILRFDEHLVGMVDVPVPVTQQRRGAPPFMTVERADTSIHYSAVTFVDPDETLMLPARIESVVVVRNSGSPRLRITQTFSDYRRFVTASRIVR
jgi:hypothetical protein